MKRYCILSARQSAAGRHRRHVGFTGCTCRSLRLSLLASQVSSLDFGKPSDLYHCGGPVLRPLFTAEAMLTWLLWTGSFYEQQPAQVLKLVQTSKSNGQAICFRACAVFLGMMLSGAHTVATCAPASWLLPHQVNPHTCQSHYKHCSYTVNHIANYWCLLCPVPP